MKTEQAINISKGCVMASFMDSGTKQAVVEALKQLAISKTETLYKAVSDGFSYDVKAKQFQCLGCHNYFYAPHPGSYCPNCGRRIIADD